jgi:peptide chain release factor 1
MALTDDEQRLIADAARRFAAAAASLANPALAGGAGARARLGRDIAAWQPVVEAGDRRAALAAERAELERVAAGPDPDLAALARAELPAITARIEAADAALRVLLDEASADPADDRGVILEIRAGTGGEEAALFAGDLLRMYLRHAERRGWAADVVDVSRTDLGGVREAVVSVEGRGAWRRLRHEGGVHRVQRVPVTESQGRIHTSAAAVSVLPQPAETDIEIRPSDLRIDTFCSSGPGGQGVNTTYSAVRIVHVPTGVVVQCQDERSQVKNKARAMAVLRARLLAREEEERARRDTAARKAQVRTADRSEKIRTYHFPQNRVTDHRIGLSLHRLREVLDGDLDLMTAALIRTATGESAVANAPG